MTSEERSPAAIGRSRPVAIVALGTWSLVIMLLAIALVIDAELLVSDEALGFWALVPVLVMPVSLASVGMLLLLRLPSNVIGWLMLVSGLVLALTTLDGAFDTGPTSEQDPAELLRIWIELPLVTIGLVLAVLVIPLFPSGRVAGNGRIAAGILIVGTIIATLGQLALSAGADEGPDAVALGQIGEALRFVGTTVILVGLVAIAGDLFVRYFRADHDDRAQMTLFVIVAAVLVVSAVLAAADLGEASVLAWMILVASIALLPVTVGVAIVQHGLYDIDLLVNRVLIYILLVAIVGFAYIMGVQLMQRVFVAVTGTRSDAAVLMALLIGVAAFTPLRRFFDKRVEAWYGAEGASDDSAADAASQAASAPPPEMDMRELDARMERIARRVIAEDAARIGDQTPPAGGTDTRR